MSFGHTSVAGSESAVARQAPSAERIRDFIGRWLDAWNSRQAAQVYIGVMPASGSRSERAMAAAQRGVIRVQSEYRRLRKDG
jgi:hypothetical protein